MSGHDIDGKVEDEGGNESNDARVESIPVT